MAILNKLRRHILEKLSRIQKIQFQRYTTQQKPPSINYSKHSVCFDEIPPFQKILIANRGEIACRIINTARKMGIKTVAVYSVADVTSKHVKLADEAVLIGPPIATHSYLDMTKILHAVTTTGAEAVHPGYGFLSENPNFVKILEDKNVTFIGPSAKAIAGMGDKLESKRLAIAAGVNTIPGYDGIIIDDNECARIAKNIGYPVIIKASAGGGGKGMRIARNDKEARKGFRLSTQEAQASFGDGRILIEKFIENARHIEIQVLGDKHGNMVHLNERECSIQRRNQKIIEEAPSTFLDNITRKSMGAQAISLCKKLGYYSAGTVEFLIDESRNFYFLEMNTRLQVEHPITECITGIDLVGQMIRIAKGHPLDIKQEDIKINGWAIESRVYAEDPYKNFGLPSTGQLYSYREPRFEGVRCDSGVEEGSVIGIYYDPMICKLICHGKTREEAIERSIKALDSYVIYGVTHNVPLLRDILTEGRFRRGDVSTNYLPEVYPGGFKGRILEMKGRRKIMAIVLAIYSNQELKNRLYLNAPSIKDVKQWDLVVSLLEESIPAKVSLNNDNFVIEIKEEIFKIGKNINLSNPILKNDINGEKITIQLSSKSSTGEFKIIYQGTVHKLRVMPKLAFDLLNKIPKKPKQNTSKIMKSPMPGLVKSVSCKIGDEIIAGQELCVIEAMKMQNSMISGANGKVKRVHVHEGDTVASDDILVQLE